MARGVNKVILIGNLGKDPEARFLPSGESVANFSVATSESWKDKQSGQMQERVEWHNAVAFNRLAEIAGQYLKKGSKVYIEGSLRTNKWQDKEGHDRYTTQVVVRDLQFLDSRGDTDAGQQEHRRSGPADSGKAYREASGGMAAPASGFDDFDDFDDQKIPF